MYGAGIDGLMKPGEVYTRMVPMECEDVATITVPFKDLHLKLACEEHVECVSDSPSAARWIDGVACGAIIPQIRPVVQPNSAKPCCDSMRCCYARAEVYVARIRQSARDWC